MSEANKLEDIGAAISLHGLGFLQVKLGGNQRLHVWHPDLPRRTCFEHTSIHDHRFGFKSSVLKGTQINRVFWHREVEQYDARQTHRLWLHDGPRGEHGGRGWDFDGFAELRLSYDQTVHEGSEYSMAPNVYHQTITPGITVTLMKKQEISPFPAHSTSEVDFNWGNIDESFDRFQLSEVDLWAIALEGLQGVRVL